MKKIFTGICAVWLPFILAGCSKGSNIRIRLKNIRIRLYYFHMILRGGLPSLARQCLASLATICLNHAARPHGDAIIAAMGEHEKVQLSGFGTFEVRERAERKGRNPKTGEVVSVPACKYLAFVSAKSVKENLN